MLSKVHRGRISGGVLKEVNRCSGHHDTPKNFKSPATVGVQTHDDRLRTGSPGVGSTTVLKALPLYGSNGRALEDTAMPISQAKTLSL